MSNEKKTALLFSGQGAQEPGMGRAMAENDPEIMTLWKKAEKLSALPLRGIYWDGGENQDDTRSLQPALTVTNLSLWMALAPNLKPAGTAGHSLGEYCALTAAGVLRPEKTLELVALRGRLMAEADPDGQGGMAALVRMSQEHAEEAVRLTLAELDAEGSESLVIANYNTPSQFVASGTRKCIALLGEKAREFKGRSLPLAVSGAFHSPLINEAAKEMGAALKKCDFDHPRFPVYSNVSGQGERNGEGLKELLLRQMVSPVRWIDTVRNMSQDGASRFVECSPKAVLSKMVGQILHPEDPSAGTAKFTAMTVSGPEDFNVFGESDHA